MNLCDKCPDGVRGYCCFYNIELEGHNLILLNQPCKFLDIDTMRCTIYEKRKELNPLCLSIDDGSIVDTGSLPKGCLYLKECPELEKNPKVDPREVIDTLSPKSVIEYNIWNNIKNIEEYAIRRKDKKV